MPLFHILAQDKPGASEIRLNNRTAHLDWIKGYLDKVKLAGPMLTENGEGMIGSVLLIEADTREALEAFLADDPYAKAGLFSSVSITPFKWVIGAPE